MKTIPAKINNPVGLYQRYKVEKLIGPTDPNAVYLVLRLDNKGTDPIWTGCCRDAARMLAIDLFEKSHLVQLSEELMALCSALEVEKIKEHVDGMTVKELLDSMDNFNLSNVLPATIGMVVGQIQKWFDENWKGSTIPIPSYTISKNYTQIQIGEVTVWDSDNDTAVELTASDCMRRYRLHCIGMTESFLDIDTRQKKDET